MKKLYKMLVVLGLTLALTVAGVLTVVAAHGRFFELMSPGTFISGFGTVVKTSKQGLPGYGPGNSCRILSLFQYRMSDPDGFERRGPNAMPHDPLRTYDMRVTQARAECKVRIEGPDQGNPGVTGDVVYLISGISYGGQVYEEFTSENPVTVAC